MPNFRVFFLELKGTSKNGHECHDTMRRDNDNVKYRGGGRRAILAFLRTVRNCIAFANFQKHL